MGYCTTILGKSKWWDVLVSPMCDDDANVKCIIAVSQDITKERATSEQLKWASEHDALKVGSKLRPSGPWNPAALWACC
jgi:hypothetical protein